MVASKVSNFLQFLISAKKSFLMLGVQRFFCTAKQGVGRVVSAVHQPQDCTFQSQNQSSQREIYRFIILDVAVYSSEDHYRHFYTAIGLYLVTKLNVGSRSQKMPLYTGPVKFNSHVFLVPLQALYLGQRCSTSQHKHGSRAC